MYLKVELDDQEQFFVFENQLKVIVGSHPDCDVHLRSEDIGSKHLLVTQEAGEFFVTDLGCENGSFLNEERLAPEVKTAFNSFFPVKLGQKALLYLVDEASVELMREEMAKKEEAAEAKRRAERRRQKEEQARLEMAQKGKKAADRVYVPKSSGAKGEKELGGQKKQIKRKSIAGKSTRVVAPKRNLSNVAFTIMVIIIGGGGFLYTQWKKSFRQSVPVNVSETKLEPDSQLVNKQRAANGKTPDKPVAAAVIGKAELMPIIALDKCYGEVESKLCIPLKKGRETGYHEGFIKFGANLYLALDLGKVSKHYQNLEYSEEERELALKKLARYLGRRFSRPSILKNNYHYKDVDLQSDLTLKVALITDLVRLKIIPTVLEAKEVKSLYVILYDKSPDKYLASAKITPADLEVFSKGEDLSNELRFFWRSGLESPLRLFFNNHKDVDLMRDAPSKPKPKPKAKSKESLKIQ